MADEPVRIEYVEARRVLLDALGALKPHLDAVVLVGAQAVYLRTEGRMAGYQPFTTDADVVLDPTLLGALPPLGDAMRNAGFVLTDEPGIWEAHIARPGFDDDIVVPVDLIVPEELAPKAGRRAARLPGDHGKTTARKSPASLAPSSTTPPSSSARSNQPIVGSSRSTLPVTAHCSSPSSTSWAIDSQHRIASMRRMPVTSTACSTRSAPRTWPSRSACSSTMLDQQRRRPRRSPTSTSCSVRRRVQVSHSLSVAPECRLV